MKIAAIHTAIFLLVYNIALFLLASGRFWMPFFLLGCSIAVFTFIVEGAYRESRN